MNKEKLENEFNKTIGEDAVNFKDNLEQYLNNNKFWRLFLMYVDPKSKETLMEEINKFALFCFTEGAEAVSNATVATIALITKNEVD